MRGPVQPADDAPLTGLGRAARALGIVHAPVKVGKSQLAAKQALHSASKVCGDPPLRSALVNNLVAMAKECTWLLLQVEEDPAVAQLLSAVRSSAFAIAERLAAVALTRTSPLASPRPLPGHRATATAG